MFDLKKQQRLVASISHRDLILNLYLTQLIFITITILLSFIFDQSIQIWFEMMSVEPNVVLKWGIPVALSVVLLDLLLWRYLPGSWVDDGGINERIFSKTSLYHIPILAFVISFAEEMLFRGVLQTNLGYIPASLLFSIMHIRYLARPVLLIVATLISFVLGGLFLLTGNLLVPITVHFLIDFILGLLIRFGWLSSRKKGTIEKFGEHGKERNDT